MSFRIASAECATVLTAPIMSFVPTVALEGTKDNLPPCNRVREIPMKPTTDETRFHRRPVLSEWQETLLRDAGLRWQVTDLTLLILHPDEMVTRLDVCDLETWMSGFHAGRQAR